MFTHLRTRIHEHLEERRQKRAIQRLEKMLTHGVTLHRYTDDSLAWLELEGQRFYFDVGELRSKVKTYMPEERERTLLTTKYRSEQ